MTGPTEAASSPDPVSTTAAIGALVENADRLGLKWNLVPATVSSTNPLTVVMDGDEVAIGATSMIGDLAQNDRVYVMIVPPSGNFVTGRAGTTSVQETILAATFRNTSTGNIGVETNIMSAANVIVPGNRLLRVEYWINSSGSVENVSIYHLYSNGVVKAAQNKENPAGTTLIDHHGWFYIGNNTGVPFTSTLTMTAAPNAGTIVICFGGGVSRMLVTDIGSYSKWAASLLPATL